MLVFSQVHADWGQPARPGLALRRCWAEGTAAVDLLPALLGRAPRNPHRGNLAPGTHRGFDLLAGGCVVDLDRGRAIPIGIAGPTGAITVNGGPAGPLRGDLAHACTIAATRGVTSPAAPPWCEKSA